MTAARRRRLLAGGLLAAVCVGAALGAAALAGAFAGPTPAQIAAERAARAAARLRRAENHAVRRAQDLVAVSTPTRRDRPAPVATGALFRDPAPPPHQVVGYVPYWTMGSLTPADYADVSVVAYYGVTAGPGGRLVESGRGWDALASSRFDAFVAAAHAAGDRVLLTVSSDTPARIADLLAHPALSADRLAGEAVALVAAHHLDGISIDVEGRSAAERRPFVRFVAALSARLRRADPHGELVLDTYPQSADNRRDFFDVAALAPKVDLLFVMGYDMYDPRRASAGAPLDSPGSGLSDVRSVLAYEKVVPADKLVLGVPFYGYDFTLAATRHPSRTRRAPGATVARHDAPVAVTYAAVAAAGRPALWDPASLTPYTAFRASGHDHETYYDDPVSVALKTALAEEAGLAGTGVWALGDEGGATGMLHALDGGTRPVKLALLPGPSAAAVAAARAGAGSSGGG